MKGTERHTRGKREHPRPDETDPPGRHSRPDHDHGKHSAETKGDLGGHGLKERRFDQGECRRDESGSEKEKGIPVSGVFSGFDFRTSPAGQGGHRAHHPRPDPEPVNSVDGFIEGVKGEVCVEESDGCGGQCDDRAHHPGEQGKQNCRDEEGDRSPGQLENETARQVGGNKRGQGQDTGELVRQAVRIRRPGPDSSMKNKGPAKT